MDKKTEGWAHDILSELRKISNALRDLLGDPRKQNEKSVTTQCHSDNENERTERNSPAVSKATPTPCKANESYDRWYQPCYWWKVAKGWTGKETIEVIGIFFAVGYAVVTFLQWQDLRHNFQ